MTAISELRLEHTRVTDMGLEHLKRLTNLNGCGFKGPS